jgi:hypothetical protein
MNRPRNGRDWAALIALILACTLALILLITVIGLVVFDKELSEEGGRLLTGVALGLVAVLSAYIGSKIGRGPPGPPAG